ncbi:hypothetical protein J3454_05620 [Erythrobacter sp. NFXS35]|uniref:hypothetical protein n=1 Tax=Erythrobacter sp. NFXS35 TaxID=2818436 RepID=UPI0032DE75FA
MSAALPFAFAALLPVLIGPLPAESRAITAALCNGGTITIPLGDGDTPADKGDCHPKACHAGNCRDKDRPERTKRGI